MDLPGVAEAVTRARDARCRDDEHTPPWFWYHAGSTADVNAARSTCRCPNPALARTAPTDLWLPRTSNRFSCPSPPVYSHAENVCRVPAYLPHVLSLNEHRGGYDETIIPMEDLANIASHRLRRHPEATLFEHARDRGRECSYRRSRPPWVSLRC